MNSSGSFSSRSFKLTNDEQINALDSEASSTVLVQKVDSQRGTPSVRLHRTSPTSNNGELHSGVRQLPKNSLLSQVGPEECLLVKVCIQSRGVPLLLHKLSVFLPLQAQTANVSAVCEDQAGLLACEKRSRRVSKAALETFRGEGPQLVY